MTLRAIEKAMITDVVIKVSHHWGAITDAVGRHGNSQSSQTKHHAP
jgi:hypothetical protein